MDVKERINEFLKIKGINANSFEISIGVSKSYWRNTKNISAEVLAEISRVYPEISAEWLLRGTGSMILDEQAVSADEAFYKNIIDDQHDLIQMLKQKLSVQERSKESETKAV